jgi:glycosyltransferase involved in cell wall biosynthesis
VVVSPTGANKKILLEADVGFGPIYTGEWYESLRILFGDYQMRRALGSNGTKLVKERYSVEVCAPQISKIIRECV